jgi:hypothetical protein
MNKGRIKETSARFLLCCIGYSMRELFVYFLFVVHGTMLSQLYKVYNLKWEDD